MRRTILTALVGWMAIVLLAAAQHPPDTLWTKTYVDGWESGGQCAQQTDDGGFILTGGTVPYGSFYDDVYLVKTDPDGNEIWFKTYGGSDVDWGIGVQQTSDGGYIVVGGTSSFSIDGKFYLIRTDSDGDSLWTRTYGSEGYDYIGTSVEQTSDGGFIVTGNCNDEISECRIVLLRYNANGDLLWDQIYRDFDAKGSSVLQLEDECFIVAGQIDLGDGDVFLMKTDQSGHILWMQTYGGPQTDSGSCVRQTHDGGFIIAGTYRFNNYNADFYLIKTDSVGDTLWTRTYGGDYYEYGKSVCQTWDGGFILTGRTDSFSPGNRDIYVVRTDSVGDTIWTDTYGGDLHDYGNSVQQTSDGGYIIGGYTANTPDGYLNAWLIRLNSEGAGLNISLTPQNPPIIIPPGGGSFVFDISIQNAAGIPFDFDAWTEAVLPDGRIFGPILERMGLTIPPGGEIERQVIQYVPPYAPSGDYTYTGIVGMTSPYSLTFSDGFEFEKLPGTDLPGHNEGWAVSGWEGKEAASVNTPAEYTLFQACPNPANPVTWVTFTLPAPQKATLAVYNLLGQKVATLAQGLQPPGAHTYLWNAAGFSSGVYVIRLEMERLTKAEKVVVIR